MPIPFPFDFKNPDYVQVFEWRVERLKRIRANPSSLPGIMAFYADNPAQFIIDWGCTFDPRNVDIGLPATIPFLLFEAQEDWINFAVQAWKDRKRTTTAKSRDMGLSWLVVGFFNTLCTFNEDLAVGYSSYKESYVDDIGNPKSFFVRLRLFRELLPREFSASYDYKTDSPFCKMIYRHRSGANSTITGEVGDNVARGGRYALYGCDEYAFWPRPQLSEASLSQATNCRIDISTPNGRDNPFAENFHNKKMRKFSFHWTKDPRKDADWYERQKENTPDPVVLAQEVDMDFDASVVGRLIDYEYIESAIDAHIKLGLEVCGGMHGALDIADTGPDLNAFACGRSWLLEYIEEWIGQGSDIFATVERSFGICHDRGIPEFKFDADGMGAGARGDARKINQDYEEARKVSVKPWKGSSSGKGLYKPEAYVNKDRGIKNKDYYGNLKAQGWFMLRNAFIETHRAVTNPDYKYDPNGLISISSQCPHLSQIKIELGQVRYVRNDRSKLVYIDKKPDGAKSPNLGDAIMMWNAPNPGVNSFYSG